MKERTYKMDEIEAAGHDTMCHQVIRASARLGGWELVEDHTPLHELLGQEDADPGASEEMRIRQETTRRLLGFLFGAGPHPGEVMRRLFATAYKFAPELIAHMTMADLGLMLGEKKQNQSYRIRVLLEGRSHARGQKRVGSRAAFSKAQMGNKSRRKGEAARRRREAERN